MTDTRFARSFRVGLPRWLVAMGVLALIAAACGDDDAVAATTIATAEATSPMTTERLVPAATIAEAGLPTVWKLTPLSTVKTEVEGGLHFDNTVRLDSEPLSIEGTVSQDVMAAEMFQGVVVDCLTTTYDGAFLWSATPPGVGELDFGESGSITFAFEAVVITSAHMVGLGLAQGNAQRVCGEWSGTYAGASGALADAAGTFTAEFAGSGHDSVGTTWTFDA